jgi:hypothetical protein
MKAAQGTIVMRPRRNYFKRRSQPMPINRVHTLDLKMERISENTQRCALPSSQLE